MTDSIDFVLFAIVVVAAFFGTMVRQVETLMSALDGNGKAAQARAKFRRASIEASIKNVTWALRLFGGAKAGLIGFTLMAPLAMN